MIFLLKIFPSSLLIFCILSYLIDAVFIKSNRLVIFLIAKKCIIALGNKS